MTSIEVDPVMVYELECVLDELDNALMKFPSFRSQHEGFAIIKEELDELWKSIKDKDNPNTYKEAVQLCAMSIRFLVDYKKMVKQ